MVHGYPQILFNEQWKLIWLPLWRRLLAITMLSFFVGADTFSWELTFKQDT